MGCQAKNSLINNGFSLHQLVFRQDMNLLNVFSDRLSASVTETKLVGEYISTLQVPCKAFFAAESSDKLNTLWKQTQNTHEFYEIKDYVYYKRDSEIKWKSPAKCFVQDDPVVFLCHGGFVVKVNCSHLQKLDKTLSGKKYVSNFQKDKKPSCQTNNDISKSKIEHDDQILSEVTKSSNTNIPFDIPIDRLTSNETLSLDKPINNSNEAENQQISHETPNANTPTDNSQETESQFVTSIETVNESNKNTTTFYKTQPDNNEIDPAKF